MSNDRDSKSPVGQPVDEYLSEQKYNNHVYQIRNATDALRKAIELAKKDGFQTKITVEGDSLITEVRP